MESCIKVCLWCLVFDVKGMPYTCRALKSGPDLTLVLFLDVGRVGEATEQLQSSTSAG